MDQTTNHREEMGNEGLSCLQHLRLICPPLNPMECENSYTIKKRQLVVEEGDKGLTAAEQFYALAS